MTAAQLHPHHGVHRQDAVTPPRRACSVRRTSTVDCLRADGYAGPVVLDAAARDLVTARDGSTTTVSEVRLTGEIDFAAGSILRVLSADPDEPRLAGLVGRSASRGFRAAVHELLPELVEAATPLHLLLDDLPPALMVSGVELLHSGTAPMPPPGMFAPMADLCAGWRAGGTLLGETMTTGITPTPTGPLSNPLERADDEMAWHEMPALPPHATRRRRRLDVHRVGDELEVDVHFRDSHMSAQGVETSIHEYSLAVVADAATMRVLRAHATPHALPWRDCGPAPLSASDVEGRTLGELRGYVRTEMTGPRTCTHLNDTLRGLDDVVALLPLATSRKGT